MVASCPLKNSALFGVGPGPVGAGITGVFDVGTGFVGAGITGGLNTAGVFNQIKKYIVKH